MTRNFKTAGIALFAACSISVVIASGAGATVDPLKLTAETFPVAATGFQVPHIFRGGHKLTTSAGTSVTCATAQLDATVTKEQADKGNLTVTPTYAHCRADPGSFKVTVTMRHCDYHFHGGNLEPGTTHAFAEITADLVCPAGIAGPQVEIWFEDSTHAAGNAPNCTLTPQAFTNKKENTAHNVPGAPDDILLTTAVTGITVVRTGSILCGAANQTATYSGNTTIEGFEDLKTINDETTTLAFEEGSTQGITLSESAGVLKLTAEKFPVALTGTQVELPGQIGHKFTTSAGLSVTCTNTTFDATVTNEVANGGAITVTPKYANCVALPGELEVTVTMTHCDYHFEGGNLEAGTNDRFSEITVDLVCPQGVAGPAVEVWFDDMNHGEAKAPDCTLTLQMFSNKGEHTGQNVTSTADDILLTTFVTGLFVVRTGSTLCGPVNQTASYTGSTTIEGFVDEGATAPYPTIKFNEGAKQGITISDPSPPEFG